MLLLLFFVLFFLLTIIYLGGCLAFIKINFFFQKKPLMNTIGLSNSLVPDQTSINKE